jgi:hypothetical protein
MSSLFVPGRILLPAPASTLLAPSVEGLSSYGETPGEVGGSWTSASGGGDGIRGDEDGDAGVAIVYFVLQRMCNDVCVAPEVSQCSTVEVPQMQVPSTRGFGGTGLERRWVRRETRHQLSKSFD